MPNEDKETLGYGNDISDNLKKKENKEEEINTIEKLIYPIFKSNKDSDKEDKGKYYLNLIFFYRKNRNG